MPAIGRLSLGMIPDERPSQEHPGRCRRLFPLVEGGSDRSYAVDGSARCVADSFTVIRDHPSLHLDRRSRQVLFCVDRNDRLDDRSS